MQSKITFLVFNQRIRKDEKEQLYENRYDY